MNAGDGRHEHPTQALLDTLTLRRHRGPSLDGMRVAIVGDIRHSRVARSNVLAFDRMGARVTLVGPPTLLPESLEGWPAAVSFDLDDLLAEVDVVYLLRIQLEGNCGLSLAPCRPEDRDHLIGSFVRVEAMPSRC